MVSTRNESGFTLLELIMVMVLIGILAATAAPRLNTAPSVIPPAADTVASDIFFTQMTAMATNVSSCMTLAGNSSSYIFGGVYTGNYPSGTCSGGMARDLTSMAMGLTVSAGQTLVFNSLGEPLGLSAPVSITIASGSYQKSLTINAFTGKVQ